MKNFKVEYIDGAMIREFKIQAKNLMIAVLFACSEQKNVIKVEEILNDVYFKEFE